MSLKQPKSKYKNFNIILQLFLKLYIIVLLIEGQLPKGSAYLDTKEHNMNKENKLRGSTVKRNVESEEISE